MNKQQLARVADAEIAKGMSPVDAVLGTIVRTVTSGEPVSVTGFARIEPVEQQERIGRNPKTGETVRVPARIRPRMRPGQNFLDLVAGDKPLPDGSAIAKAPRGTRKKAEPAGPVKTPGQKAAATRQAKAKADAERHIEQQKAAMRATAQAGAR